MLFLLASRSAPAAGVDMTTLRVQLMQNMVDTRQRCDASSCAAAAAAPSSMPVCGDPACFEFVTVSLR